VLRCAVQACVVSFELRCAVQACVVSFELRCAVQACVVSYVYHLGKVSAWPSAWGPVTVTAALVAAVTQFR
jgi:hypothetical protein